MRVLVCGGRDYTNTKRIYEVLDDMLKWCVVDCIIEGDAKGVDRIAGYWAKKNRIDLKIFPPNWGKYGKSAGFVRNKQMLEEGRPALVVAFPGGKGTAMMIRLAREAGVEVLVFD